MKLQSLFFTGYILIFTLFVAFVPPQSDQKSNDKFVVVLDAGHGGHDPGNLGNGYLEKNIALGIVLEAGKMLETHSDIEVVYTRKEDRFVDLYVRGEIANKAKADLFVSVHCDSHSSDANGAGTFVLGLHANQQNFEIAKKENSVIYLEDNYETRYAAYDINSPESIIGLTIMQEEFLDQSILLGKMMQDNFVQKLNRKDRKVKQAGFIVLHQTFMPSVLVETGFLTNKSEGAYLNSKKGQSEIGKAIAEAIVTYKTNLWSGRTTLEEPGENVITAAPEAPTPKEVEVREEPTATRADQEELKTAEENNLEVSEAAEGMAVETQIVNAEKESPKPAEKPEQPAVEKELKIEQEPERTDIKPEENLDKAVVVEQSTENIPQASRDNIDTAKEAADNAKQAKMTPKSEDPKPVPSETTKSGPKKTANITFKVQILASSKNIPLQSTNFKGLSTITKEPYNNLFRYMYGKTNSYEQAKLLKSNADLKGYTTSFIVAYKDGKRIPVKEAMKYISE